MSEAREIVLEARNPRLSFPSPGPVLDFARVLEGQPRGH